MTGPEHYQYAQQLLENAGDEEGFGSDAERFYLAKAQVHATLALAAATAVTATAQGQMSVNDGDAWERVASEDNALAGRLARQMAEDFSPAQPA